MSIIVETPKTAEQYLSKPTQDDRMRVLREAHSKGIADKADADKEERRRNDLRRQLKLERIKFVREYVIARASSVHCGVDYSNEVAVALTVWKGIEAQYLIQDEGQ